MRKALVTGASRGIGKSIKNLFENYGIKVIAPSRSELDLNNKESIELYINELEDNVDILINNAGINDLACLEEITESQIQNMLQVNLTSYLSLIRLLTPQMKKNSYGRIINISSIWSSFSKEKRILYSIAKAGVDGLTRASCVELSQYNILVNSIAPGFVNTEMTAKNNTANQIKEITKDLPIRRLAQPEEIAEAVYFLSSEKNTFITGQTIFIDGGFSCV